MTDPTIEAGGLLFGNGMILAIFHSFGSLPSRSEQLKIAVSGGASRAAWSFKTQAGVLSGPDALFVLILHRALKVVCILIIHSSGNSPSNVNTSLSTFKRGKCSLTDTQKSFMLLARISQFPSATLFANPCIFELSFVSMPISFFHVFPPIVGPRAPQGGYVLLIKVISKLCSGTINFIAEHFFLCKMSAHVGSLPLTNQ